MRSFQIIGKTCTRPQLLGKHMSLTERQPLVNEQNAVTEETKIV